MWTLNQTLIIAAPATEAAGCSERRLKKINWTIQVEIAAFFCKISSPDFAYPRFLAKQHSASTQSKYGDNSFLSTVSSFLQLNEKLLNRKTVRVTLVATGLVTLAMRRETGPKRCRKALYCKQQNQIMTGQFTTSKRNRNSRSTRKSLHSGDDAVSLGRLASSEAAAVAAAMCS